MKKNDQSNQKKQIVDLEMYEFVNEQTSTSKLRALRRSPFVQTPNSEDFAIPELPTGQHLSFVLLSPWDDPFYMGLNTIEIFTIEGIRPEILNIETDANESFGDLKGLLYCKTCKTTDPRGMWMCKYRSCSQDPNTYGNNNAQLPITINITLKCVETIAMIRIWNYSESRVHALRGVCRMRIELDKNCIFKGEISCAFSAEADEFAGRPMGDTILFTICDEVLNKIAKNDEFLNDDETNDNFSFNKLDDLKTKQNPSVDNLFKLEKLNIIENKTSQLNNENFTIAPRYDINVLMEIQRPATGTTLSADFANSPAIAKKQIEETSFSFQDKDLSMPIIAQKDEKINNDDNDDDEDEDDDHCEKINSSKIASIIEDQENESKQGGIFGKVFHMEILANWGASDLVGFTGIQFLGPNSVPIFLENCVIRYNSYNSPNKINVNSDSLLKLINGNNLTDNQDEMWLQKWTQSDKSPMISFNFAHEICLAGVSIWNYNGSSELSYCGVKCVQFYINGRPICGPVLLRRAPGYVYFDYVQDVLFDRCHLFRPLSSRPNTYSVSAFIFELRLLSSWNDEYYIGLNGVELYNNLNQLVRLRLQNLAAFPESVNILPSMKNDPRSSDKLIDGVNDTKKPYHMWLTPMLPNNYARVFFIFDSPVSVSRIRLFNYRKTPERGVRHVSIIADDLIIFSGEMPKSTASVTGILDISLRDLN